MLKDISVIHPSSSHILPYHYGHDALASFLILIMGSLVHASIMVLFLVR